MKNILELITNATSLQQNIVSACSSISICANCILRYLGIRSLDLHLKVMNENPFRIRHQQASGHELRPKGVNLIATKENHDSNTEAKLLCPSCLGLFQLDFKSLSLDAVKLMRMENYILKEQTFCVAIKLPPQLIIRHQAVIHYIQRHLTADESFDFPDYIEVKEVFKYLVRDSFAKESNLSYATESPFAFTIYVDHSQTDEDYLFLTKIPEAKFDAKASKKRGRTFHKGASQDKIAKAVALVSSEQYFEYFEFLILDINNVRLLLFNLIQKLRKCFLCIVSYMSLVDIVSLKDIFPILVGSLKEKDWLMIRWKN